jgi:hypothetical protein
MKIVTGFRTRGPADFVGSNECVFNPIVLSPQRVSMQVIYKYAMALLSMLHAFFFGILICGWMGLVASYAVALGFAAVGFTSLAICGLTLVRLSARVQ